MLQEYADKRIGGRVGRRPLVPSSANGVSGERSIIIPLWLFDDIAIYIVSHLLTYKHIPSCEVNIMERSKSGREVTT